MAGTAEGKTRPLLSLCSPGRGFLMERGNEKNNTRYKKHKMCCVAQDKLPGTTFQGAAAEAGAGRRSSSQTGTAAPGKETLRGGASLHRRLSAGALERLSVPRG